MTAKKEADLRSKIVATALWGVAHEPQIHYSMGSDRDDWLQNKTIALPLSTDCSGFVTLCYWHAGAPDPSGLGYRYLGYTGTLLAHCKHIQPGHAKPGDLIVYGPGTGHHVVVVVGGSADGIQVVSHGRESGPNRLPNHTEAGFQPHPVTFLRIPEFT